MKLIFIIFTFLKVIENQYLIEFGQYDVEDWPVIVALFEMRCSLSFASQSKAGTVRDTGFGQCSNRHFMGLILLFWLCKGTLVSSMRS